MLDVLVASSCLLLVASALALESWALRRARRAIPWRIVVTGTRGKSSVTRLIAAGLRAGGLRVVYKTTGSAAVVGDPDAREHALTRRSVPSPLEQRGILRRAVRWRASALVVEAMSIRPESLFAEVRRILVPQLVVITNVRPDHVADLPDPIEAFVKAIPADAFVLYPASAGVELRDALASRALRSESVAPLPEGIVEKGLPYLEWPDNLALAVAACARAGVAGEVALRGMRDVRPDVGALAAWRVREGTTDWIAVNAFAANDPESTAAALRRSEGMWGHPGQRRVGLLNLRRDRGDRTAQWFSTLLADKAMFDRVVLVGDVPLASARAVRRGYGNAVHIVRSRRASRVMAELGRIEPNGGLVFGFGNIGGLGMRLVEHWNREGEGA